MRAHALMTSPPLSRVGHLGGLGHTTERFRCACSSMKSLPGVKSSARLMAYCLHPWGVEAGEVRMVRIMD